VLFLQPNFYFAWKLWQSSAIRKNKIYVVRKNDAHFSFIYTRIMFSFRACRGWSATSISACLRWLHASTFMLVASQWQRHAWIVPLHPTMGLGQFGNGTFRWSNIVFTKKACCSTTLELPYNSTSKDRRKRVTDGELISQLNYSKSFLKWRFSWRPEPDKG